MQKYDMFYFDLPALYIAHRACRRYNLVCFICLQRQSTFSPLSQYRRHTSKQHGVGPLYLSHHHAFLENGKCISRFPCYGVRQLSFQHEEI